MSWVEYVPKVIIPNLPHRTDRKDRIIKMLYEYGIEATIWEAIPHEKGAFGLMLTMKDIFKWCLNEGLERVLVLEDDCEILVSADEFHSTMDKCCEDLQKINWELFYLGTQQRQFFSHWITQNILPIQQGFSTHSVLYSKAAMEFFMSSHIDQPIDNFLVHSFQKYNTSFCSYPILCSQIEGHSDIGGEWISWKPFLEKQFEISVKDILPHRFKQKT